MTRALALALAVGSGCGYSFAARPPLPGGVTRVDVPVFENPTPEVAIGSLLARQLAQRAAQEDRFGGGGAQLLGRVEALTVSPLAFAGGVPGAAQYVVRLRVRVRLVRVARGPTLREVVVTDEETYLAGRFPEETESNRRRATQRLGARVASEVWSRLTAPE